MANSWRMRLEGLWYMYIEVIYSVDDNMVVFTCTVVCYLVNHCCAYGKPCELFPNSVSSCYIEIVFIKHLCYRAIMRFGHFYLGMKKMPVLIKYFL